jgi:hypothetical protein
MPHIKFVFSISAALKNFKVTIAIPQFFCPAQIENTSSSNAVFYISSAITDCSVI